MAKKTVEENPDGGKACTMCKIGVTGSAGSGKSVACRRFGELGLPVLSADELARQAVMPGMPAYESIVDCFGREVLAADGMLNRPLLREMIVKDSTVKKRLEGFVHPEVFALMQKGIDDAERGGHPGVVVEVPLLFELGMESMFDFTILISTSHDIQVRRLASRDGVSVAQAEGLINIQMPVEEKMKKADLVISNHGRLADLLAAVDQVYKKMIEKQP